MLLIILKREAEREGDKLQTKSIVSIICPSAVSGVSAAVNGGDVLEDNGGWE